MTRNSTAKLENRDRERIFSSPVARAFVRIATQRRGISEAQAEQIFSTTSTELIRPTPVGVMRSRDDVK